MSRFPVMAWPTPTPTLRIALASALGVHAALAAGPTQAQSVPGAVPKIRDVRVLLASDAPRVRLRADGPLTLFEGPTPRAAGGFTGDGVIAWHDGGVVRIAGASWSAPRVTARPSDGDAVRVSLERDGQWSAEVAYPGAIHLSVDDAGLEVVNELDLDRYVACVVANEVWPTFETEAFRAQAIVARTFVLYHMSRRSNAPYDVSATQGSQVYRGVRGDAVGRRAAEAAEYTRGIVLTWRDHDEDRLFCTYYSAACGGASQSAALLGPEGDAAPLRGGVRCDYCKIAPGDTYRWGPVRLKADELLSRLLERYPELAALGRITDIAPLEQTPSGRLISLRITGSSGTTHDILAERFRLAVGPTVVRSTDCRILVSGDEVIFENGKGYGHGLGLCQWGMQGLAQSGKPAAEILRFYYPGSKLTRVY